MAEYTAASIIILESDQVLDKFFWAKANDLAVTYRKPLEWIERGLQACERVGVPHDYFINRYLKKQPQAHHEGVSAAMADILKEAIPSGRRSTNEVHRGRP